MNPTLRFMRKLIELLMQLQEHQRRQLRHRPMMVVMLEVQMTRTSNFQPQVVGQEDPQVQADGVQLLLKLRCKRRPRTIVHQSSGSASTLVGQSDYFITLTKV